MGLIAGMLLPLYVGFDTFLLSPESFVQKPLRWLQAISKYKATFSTSPNFAFDLCIRKIEPEEKKKLDLSSWRVCLNAAEPVRIQTMQQFYEQFKSTGFRYTVFHPGYGLAEATLLLTGDSAGEKNPVAIRISTESLAKDTIELVDEETAKKLPQDETLLITSSGKTWPQFHMIKIVDPSNLQECKANHIGEIWVKGDTVAAGYYQKPQETNAIFQNFLVANDGPYMRTGDLGFFYNEEMYICGRLKDVIIIRGFKHYPQGTH